MKSMSMLSRATACAVGLLASAIVLHLSGCASAPPPPAPTITVTAKVPNVTGMAESSPGNHGGGRRVPEAQEKGGIEIAVVPATYRAVKRERVAIQPINAGFGNALAVSLATGGNAKNQVYVQEVTTPYLDVEPARLLFTVRVNNKLSRVFRGQGAVVQFNVAGKLIPFGQTDYADFMNGIVPPRNENTFTIRGPRLDSLPDKCSIGIFLYDVITATDAAGNTTEKQNYEWYFDYTASTVSETASKKVVQGYMDIPSFQQRMARQQLDAMRPTDTR